MQIRNNISLIAVHVDNLETKRVMVATYLGYLGIKGKGRFMSLSEKRIALPSSFELM